MKIEETWNILELEGYGMTSGYLNRRILAESNRDLSLAIEKPSGVRMFMMYVNRASVDKNMVFPASGGFEVRRMIFQGDDRIALQLILANGRYKDIFTALVQDIAENIAFIPVEADAVQMLATVSRKARSRRAKRRSPTWTLWRTLVSATSGNPSRWFEQFKILAGSRRC